MRMLIPAITFKLCINSAKKTENDVHAFFMAQEDASETPVCVLLEIGDGLVYHVAPLIHVL